MYAKWKSLTKRIKKSKWNSMAIYRSKLISFLHREIVDAKSQVSPNAPRVKRFHVVLLNVTMQVGHFNLLFSWYNSYVNHLNCTHTHGTFLYVMKCVAKKQNILTAVLNSNRFQIIIGALKLHQSSNLVYCRKYRDTGILEMTGIWVESIRVQFFLHSNGIPQSPICLLFLWSIWFSTNAVSNYITHCRLQ